MKRFAHTLVTSFALLVAGQGSALASSASSAPVSSTPVPSMTLKLKQADAKRLRGDRLQFTLKGAQQYRYTVYAGQRVVAELDMSSTTTSGRVVDRLSCDFGKSQAQLWIDTNRKAGTKGSKRAVRHCKDVARSVGVLLDATPHSDWDTAGSIAATEPGLEAGVSCKVATTGTHKGKCMCKCDHGWNPWGALFCGGFYLTGSAISNCHVGIGCEAPASSCAN